jgi:signal transduction histidine kinase
MVRPILNRLRFLSRSGSDEKRRFADSRNEKGHEEDVNLISDQLWHQLSHELKRPLASLQQSIGLLLDEVQGPLTDGQRRLIEIQLRNAKRLSNCISSLGDLAHEGTASYHLEMQDIVPLLAELAADFEFQASQRKVQIEVDVPQRPLTIECDRDAISRAIGHLIENAITFSPPGGTVRISVREAPEITVQSRKISMQPGTNGFVMVTVADSGPGIPEPQREMIFRKFYQIKKTRESYQPGLGIGLTVCRRIVEAHHGDVWVENDPGGGSLFSVLLPKATNNIPATSRQ